MNRTPDDLFVDRVMEAIGFATAPSPTRSLLAAVRRWSLTDAMSALTVAWHLGTVQTWPVAPRVRARSLALVFAVAFILGTSSLAAAAAVTVVVPLRTEHQRTLDGLGADRDVVPAATDAPLRVTPTHGPVPVPADVHPAEIAGGGTSGSSGKAAQPAAVGHQGDEGDDRDDHDGGDDGDDGPDDHGSSQTPRGSDDGDEDADGDKDDDDDHDSAETPEPDDDGDHDGDGDHGGEHDDGGGDDESDDGGGGDHDHEDS